MAALGDFGIRLDLFTLLELERLTNDDCRRQRRFAVVDVPNGAHVHVRLVPLKYALSHRSSA